MKLSDLHSDMLGPTLTALWHRDEAGKRAVNNMLKLPFSTSPLPYLEAADMIEEQAETDEPAPILAALREVARVLKVSRGFKEGLSADKIGGLGLRSLVNKWNGWGTSAPQALPLRPPGKVSLSSYHSVRFLVLSSNGYPCVGRGARLSKTAPFTVLVSPKLSASVALIRGPEQSPLNRQPSAVHMHPLALYFWLTLPYENNW